MKVNILSDGEFYYSGKLFDEDRLQLPTYCKKEHKCK